MRLRIVLAIGVLALVAVGVRPSAAQLSPTVVVDGVPLAMPAGHQAFVEDGVTMVPVRPLLESLGAEVFWDGATSQVSGRAPCMLLRMTVDEIAVGRNGLLDAMPQPLRLVDGRAYAPLRYVSEAFGATVTWNGELMTVSVSTGDALVRSCRWGLPMAAGSFVVSSEFGRHSEGFHSGIDLAAPAGTSVVAPRPGRVVYSGWDGGFGISVIIDHGDGFVSRYAHLSRALVEAGHVSRDQEIAQVGSTGNTTGSALHFEIWLNGEVQNPRIYLPLS